ncbi:MAG: autotransporter-associated beta strand repeat-containing protein [Tepidisphaeraceae bacterium]
MNHKTHLVHLATLGIVTLGAQYGVGANLAFDNTAGTFEWTTASNWSTDVLPGGADNADFRDGLLTGTGPFVVTVASPVGPIVNLRFGTGAAAGNPLTKDVTLSGSGITVTGNGVGTNGVAYNANSTASVVVNNDIVIAGDLEFGISAPTSGNNFITLNGIVGESGGSRVFKKTQNGKLVLTNAANSFTGGVLVQNGTLAVPVISALGSGTLLSLGNSTNTAAIVGNLQYTGAADATLGKSIVTLTNGGTGGGLVESTNIGVTLTLASADTVTGTGRFSFGGNGNVVLNSLVSTTGNNVIKTGVGNAWLNNTANTYTGGTVVRNGSLTIADSAALGNTSGITLADASSSVSASPVLLTNGSTTISPAITITSITDGTGTSTLGGASSQVSQSSAFAGSVTLNRDVRLTSSTAAGYAISFTGNISDGTGAFGVTKVGAGTVILSGTNDYDGPTIVSEGRLLINGSQSNAAGALSIASTATLGGTGSIAGNVTADAGSFLSPGQSIGTLTTGNVNLNGSLALDVNGTGSGTSDLLAAQSLVLGSTATINFSITSPLDDAAYVFASYASLDITAFNLANITGVPSGYAVDFNYNDANQLALVNDVPEPTAGVFVFGLLIGGAGRSRRKSLVQRLLHCR